MSVFAAAGLVPEGMTRWGSPPPQTSSGVYVVALTDQLTATTGAQPQAPLSAAALETLLARPELRLDGVVPAADQLARRLRAFWPADEVVVYIGLATSLRRRVAAYYRTPLGAKRPHAGGWWLKALSCLDDLWVHYAPTPEFKLAEKAMLRAFADAMSPATRRGMHDRERLMPFANLRGWDDLVKRHGLTGATG